MPDAIGNFAFRCGTLAPWQRRWPPPLVEVRLLRSDTEELVVPVLDEYRGAVGAGQGVFGVQTARLRRLRFSASPLLRFSASSLLVARGSKLFDDGDDGADADRVARLHSELDDFASDRAIDLVFHLHRLKDADRLIGLDLGPSLR